MRYFLDTEFIDGDPPDLISIGIAADDGRTLYLESSEFDAGKANEFVRSVVLPGLSQGPRYTRAQMAEMMRAFTARDSAVEFWGFFADWDWVLVLMCFGGVLSGPANWPDLCYDVAQYANQAGLGVPARNEVTHNALADALWTQKALDKLIQAG